MARRALHDGRTTMPENRRPSPQRGFPEPEPRQLSPEEGEALLEERSQRLLGMSADEFRRRYAAGELTFEDDNVLELAMLLPFGR
jgi:hypothetical protein